MIILALRLENLLRKGVKQEKAQKIKEMFVDGDDLQIMTAIKCLDEGVNIPSIKTAFIMASSTNPQISKDEEEY